MVNNKGYVLTPLLILFFVLITLFVYSFRQAFIGRVNNASYVMGVMDSFSFNNSKRVLSFIDSFKLNAYSNLSSSSRYFSFLNEYKGTLVNNPFFIIYIPGINYSNTAVNASFGSKYVNISINYPLSSLVLASSVAQTLISSLGSTSCKGIIVNGFIAEPVGFCSCNYNVDFIMFNNSDGMTLLYPFFIEDVYVPCIE